MKHQWDFVLCQEATYSLESQSKICHYLKHNYKITIAFLYPSHWHDLIGKGQSPLLSPSGDLGIGLVWDNPTGPDPTDFLVSLLKSSSNWTKLSMRGPQLFSGWYQMILGVFRCLSSFPMFSDCFLRMFFDCWNSLQAELNYLWWTISDDFRCLP